MACPIVHITCSLSTGSHPLFSVPLLLVTYPLIHSEASSGFLTAYMIQGLIFRLMPAPVLLCTCSGSMSTTPSSPPPPPPLPHSSSPPLSPPTPPSPLPSPPFFLGPIPMPLKSRNRPCAVAKGDPLPPAQKQPKCQGQPEAAPTPLPPASLWGKPKGSQ